MATMQGRPHFRRKISHWISLGSKDKDKGFSEKGIPSKYQSSPPDLSLFNDKLRASQRSQSQPELRSELHNNDPITPLERSLSGDFVSGLREHAAKKPGSRAAEEISAFAGEVFVSEAREQAGSGRGSLDSRSNGALPPAFRPRSPWRGKHGSLFKIKGKTGSPTPELTGKEEVKGKLHSVDVLNGEEDGVVQEGRTGEGKEGKFWGTIGKIRTNEKKVLTYSESGRIAASKTGSPKARKTIGSPIRKKAQSVNKPRRVISLLGAATEVIGLLGMEHVLVGRSHECTRPESVERLPCVSSPAMGKDLDCESSAGIDGKVQELLKKGLARYSLDLQTMSDLQPDLIITQDACSVCAVSLDELQQAAGEYLAAAGRACQILSLQPTTVAHVWENIRQIADALGEPEKGEALMHTLQSRWAAVEDRIPTNAEAPSANVACLQWLDPLMGAGYWVPEIVQCAGGTCATGQAGEATGVLSLEQLLKVDPEIIVVMCCGYGLDAAARELSNLERKKEWTRLRAVASGRVFLVDGSRYFNSSGPAIVDSAELLAEILHGWELGCHLYEGAGFIRWKTSGRGVSSPARSRSPSKPSHVLVLNDDLEAALDGFRLPKDSPLNWIKTSTNWDMEINGKVAGLKLDDESEDADQRRHEEAEREVGEGGNRQRREGVVVSSRKGDLVAEGTGFLESLTPRKGYRIPEYLDDTQLLERLADGVSVNGSVNGKRVESIDLEKGTLVKGGMQKNGWLQAPKPPKWGPPSPTGRDSTLHCLTAGSKNNAREDGELGGRVGPTEVGDGEVMSNPSSTRGMTVGPLVVTQLEGDAADHEENTPNAEADKEKENTIRKAETGEGSAVNPHRVEDELKLQEMPNGSSMDHVTVKDVHPLDNSLPNPNPSMALRTLLLKVLSDTLPADCLLLSGGLASDVLAEAALEIGKGGFKSAITVACGAKAADRPHSTAVAMKTGLPQIVLSQRPMDLLEAELKFVVRTLRTFDPLEVRSGLALAGALRMAQQQGFTSVVTGDGAEELFTGYGFMAKMTEPKLQECRQHMVEYLRYPVVALGEALGLEVRQPFLHKDIRRFALGLSKVELMGENFAGEGDGPAGKLLLRQAFPEVYAAGRQKEQIEVGAGTASLKRTLSRRISPDEFRMEKMRIRKEDRIRLRDAEQLHYYRAFRTVVGGPDLAGVVRFGPEACVACGYPPMFADQLVCSTCGEYPARKASRGGESNKQATPEAGHSMQESKAKVGGGGIQGRNVPKSVPVSSEGRDSRRGAETDGKNVSEYGRRAVGGGLKGSTFVDSHSKVASGLGERLQVKTTDRGGRESNVIVGEDCSTECLKSSAQGKRGSGPCQYHNGKIGGGWTRLNPTAGQALDLWGLLEGAGKTLMEAGKGGALEDQGVGALLESIDNGLGAWHEMIYGDSEASSEGGSVIEIDFGSRTESEGDEEGRGEVDHERMENGGNMEGSKSAFVPARSILRTSSPVVSSTISGRLPFPRQQGR